MLSDFFVGEKKLLCIIQPRQLLLIGDDLMDRSVAKATEPEPSPFHLLLRESLLEVLVSMNCTAEEMMKIPLHLSPTQVTDTERATHV